MPRRRAGCGCASLRRAQRHAKASTGPTIWSKQKSSLSRWRSSQKAFFTQLGFAARTFKADREYLYAFAFCESGGVIKNVKSKSSEAFGPFRFKPETWKELVGKFGDQDGVTEADIVVPSKQVLFAARYASASQQALAEKLKRPPTGVELYLAHLLGDAGASAALSPPTSRPIDASLRENFSASFVDGLLTANRDLLKVEDDDRVRTTDEVLDEIARRLDKGFKEAAALTKQLGPPIPQAPNAGELNQTLPKAKQAFDTFVAAGWTKEQACGIVANIHAESRFNFQAIGDSGTAFGLCQWRGDRQTLFNTAFNHPITASTFQEQLDFITFELRKGAALEKKAGAALEKETTPGAAASTFCRLYERPRHPDKDSEIRAELADTYASLL